MMIDAQEARADFNSKRDRKLTLMKMVWFTAVIATAAPVSFSTIYYKIRPQQGTATHAGTPGTGEAEAG